MSSMYFIYKYSLLLLNKRQPNYRIYYINKVVNSLFGNKKILKTDSFIYSAILKY